MKKFEIIIIVAILALTFSLRTYKISGPVADWHSWRQADTAAVARNFVKEDFNILYPRSDSLTALNDYGLQNPNRYFINEFPLYNATVALFYKAFGVNLVLARLVSISAATIGTLFLYLFARKLFGSKIATLASIFYAANPYNIYYGRVIMPDPMFISFSIATMYFMLEWTQSKKLWLCLVTATTFASALLVKPYTVFLLIPIFYWLAINWQIKAIKNIQIYIFLICSLLPFSLWRLHVAAHPEGTFATSWLFNAGNIRFTGSFFRWLIFERLNRLIFATGGFVLFAFGAIKSHTSKNGSLIFAWLFSVVLYMTVFAKGNVNHDYYQLPIMPVGAILVSLGFFTVINNSQKYYARLINIIIAVSLLVISFAFGWFEVRGFYNVNRPEIVTAGERADILLPKDAVILAPYNDDPSFLYQTNRYGYTQIDKPLGEYFSEGIKYVVSVDLADPPIQKLTADCKIIEKTDKYAIIEMSPDCTQ